MSSAWQGSTRRRRLPPDWPTTRRRILARDHWQCTANDNGQRCPNPATDVDHVTRGDDHSDSNLASLCTMHHRQKSGREGNAERNRHRLARPGEQHPGMA